MKLGDIVLFSSWAVIISGVLLTALSLGMLKPGEP